MVKKYLPLFILGFLAELVWANTQPQEVVENYLNAYSQGVSGTELVRTYWMPTLITHSRGRNASQISSDQFAMLLEAFRDQVTDEGWLGSEIVNVSSCMLREDLAIVNVQYLRHYKNGMESLDAVVYSLNGTAGWRLSSVWPVDTSVMIECSTPE